MPLNHSGQAGGEDSKGSHGLGSCTLFTDVALVAVGPDAVTAVALWIGTQQQLLFFAGACFWNSKFNSLRPSHWKLCWKLICWIQVYFPTSTVVGDRAFRLWCTIKWGKGTWIALPRAGEAEQGAMAAWGSGSPGLGIRLSSNCRTSRSRLCRSPPAQGLATGQTSVSHPQCSE